VRGSFGECLVRVGILAGRFCPAGRSDYKLAAMSPPLTFNPPISIDLCETAGQEFGHARIGMERTVFEQEPEAQLVALVEALRAADIDGDQGAGGVRYGSLECLGGASAGSHVSRAAQPIGSLRRRRS
jgi:hypothetical protein